MSIQPYVKATPYLGVDKPLDQFSSEMEITDDLPPEVIGECVVQAVKKAWDHGHNPAKPPFW